MPTPEAAGSVEPGRRGDAPRTVDILILEPDALVRDGLVGALALHNRSYRPLAAGDFATALETTRRARVRLAVSELVLPAGPEPRRLVARLREALPGVPLLALTRTPELAFRSRLALDALLEMPTDLDHLLARVDELVERGSGGVLRGVSLGSLLQILAADGLDCAVDVESSAARARLWLDRGRLVDARFGALRGKEALFAALALPLPVLRIREEAPPARTIDAALAGLLLEFSILQDHGARP